VQENAMQVLLANGWAQPILFK